LFWDIRPPGLSQLAEAILLKGDLIMDVRIISIMCRNKSPFRGVGGKMWLKGLNNLITWTNLKTRRNQLMNLGSLVSLNI
jgi:hypothetical protein